jgi:hypothetical protein
VALRNVRANLGEEAGNRLVRSVDQAVRTIRQRLIDQKWALPDFDLTTALGALRSTDRQEQSDAIQWLDKANFDKVRAAQAIEQILATTSELLKKGRFIPKTELSLLFIHYAGEKNLDDLAELCRERDKTVASAALHKFVQLSPQKLHELVLAHAEDAMFRIDMFGKFKWDPAAFEDEVDLCLKSSSTALLYDAAMALRDMGTKKSLGPLQALKDRLKGTKPPQDVSGAIDIAIKAIQARTEGAAK